MRDQLLKTAVLVGLAASANADTGWTGAISSDVTDVGNWDNGLPSPANGAIFFNNTATNEPLISSDVSAGWDVLIGQGGFNSTVNQDAGTLSTGNNNWLFVGDGGGTGTYNIEGSGNLSAGKMNVAGWTGSGSTGTVNVDTSGTVDLYSTGDRGFGSAALLVGEAGGGGNTGNFNLMNGTVNVSDQAVFGHNSTGNLSVSGGSLNVQAGNLEFARNNGSATMDVTGGAISVANEFQLGVNGSGTATATQSGGAISSANYFVIGRQGNGSYSMTGGTVDAATAGGFTSIASGRGVTGSLSVGGDATFTSNAGMILGEGWTGTGSAQGTLTVSGTGSVVVGGTGIEMGTDVDAVGTLNLDGGTLTTVDISTGAGTGNLNFNGGLLRASADTTDFITGVTANVNAGGANIDSNGFNVTSQSNLSGAGDLDKQGSGSLTLAGSGNSVNAATVSAGTLFITGQLGTTAGTSVLSGATIGGNGTLLGDLSIASGATIDISLGALNVDPGATVSFGGFDFDNIGGFDVNTAGAGTYNILAGTFTLDSANIAHYGELNALDLGGGKSAWFEEGSLNVVVVPEPHMALLGGLGVLALLRRRRS